MLAKFTKIESVERKEKGGTRGHEKSCSNGESLRGGKITGENAFRRNRWVWVERKKTKESTAPEAAGGRKRRQQKIRQKQRGSRQERGKVIKFLG